MDEPGDSTELFLYKLIIDKGMQDTFPNVAIALRMYIVLMVTIVLSVLFPNSS